MLDLANHEAQPSALFTYSAVGGGSIRLHATRPLLEGDAVTITYGEHSAWLGLGLGLALTLTLTLPLT